MYHKTVSNVRKFPQKIYLFIIFHCCCIVTNLNALLSNILIQNIWCPIQHENKKNLYWRLKLLGKATPWKCIHLTSRLLNTIFADEWPGIKTGSPECQPDALTTMLPWSRYKSSWLFLRKGGIQESACQMNAFPWHGFL